MSSTGRASVHLRPIALHQAGLADQIYESIGEAIVAGSLAPGTRLRDKDLAEELGVSRTPVREALQRLTRVGLVEMSPSRFTRVAEDSDDTVANTLEYTGIQAGAALHLAVLRMTGAEMQEAIGLLDRVIAASDAEDADELMSTALQFVRFVVDRTGNPVVRRMMSEAGLLIERNLRQVRPLLGDAASRGEVFRRMRRAMLDGDADGAERWFRRQLGVGRDSAAR
jgi:DNA-binding GntR family transcriptional regulator